jgi:hypothetical protein|tara:strand:- start:2551 stop:2847 length:297 start_codon:yes stop_codon:yes gene_type:complete
MDYFDNPNRYKGHYDMYSMFSDCGIEERGGDETSPGLFYIKETSVIADGIFNGYYPNFLGFGKSDRVSTKAEVRNGKLLSLTLYDKSGNILKYTEPIE